RVLFTDESTFSLSSDSHHTHLERVGKPQSSLEHRIEKGPAVLEVKRCSFVWGRHTCLFTFHGRQFTMSLHSSCRTALRVRILNVWIGRHDLNPIEHVWDFLGRSLAARTLPPVMIRELRLALQDEWAAMSQQLIDTLILSMDRL
ncbi:transposable element Tcb2 transposase, partial [Trichonephila clavipes]